MYEDRIAIDPAVRHGKPIIRGTRVPLEIILGSLAGGMEIDEIVREYDLQKEDVLAALEYATRLIAGEDISAYAKPKFLLDADMPRSSAAAIRSLGFDVPDVRDMGMRYAKDQEIIDYALNTGRMVITRDLDYGEILRYPQHPGADLRIRIKAEWGIN